MILSFLIDTKRKRGQLLSSTCPKVLGITYYLKRVKVHAISVNINLNS